MGSLPTRKLAGAAKGSIAVYAHIFRQVPLRYASRVDQSQPMSAFIVTLDNV